MHIFPKQRIFTDSVKFKYDCLYLHTLTSYFNSTGQVLAIFVSKAEGQMLLDYMSTYRVVNVQILEGHKRQVVGEPEQHNPTNISKTSVMFVSISFVVLMIISLAWLVFYYIQRFRYAHAKERLTVSPPDLFKEKGIVLCVFLGDNFGRV